MRIYTGIKGDPLRNRMTGRHFHQTEDKDQQIAFEETRNKLDHKKWSIF
jgi:hypothetical protein